MSRSVIGARMIIFSRMEAGTLSGPASTVVQRFKCLYIWLVTPLWFEVIAFVTSVGAGLLGSLLGFGGGIIIVPILTLFLHVNIHFATGASIVAVIATSSGAAAAYVK